MRASRPFRIKSNTVPRFSGDGAVTKMLLNPYTIAPEIAMPRAADFPLPLPAVRLIVAFKFFSEIVSTIVMTDLA